MHGTPPPLRRRRATTLSAAVAAGALGLTLVPALHTPAQAVAPTAVSVPGTFNSEIGCPGDWATDCDQAQLTARTDGSGAWSKTLTLPAGSYAYKAAINKSWNENYGAKAQPAGADIPLTVPAGGRKVTFVYDPVTHWITDDINHKIVTAGGSFQSELGCAADWAPDCLTSWLKDIDGDGTYTWSTTAIPAGTHKVKAAIGQSWAESYGQGGSPGGADISFTVPQSGSTTEFRYNSSSHVLTVQTGSSGGGGSEPAAGTLGATYTPARTTFRIWSPDSSAVSVTVGGQSHSLKPVALAGYTDVYEAVVSGDWKNQAYQFRVGSNTVRDPYARMVRPGTTEGVVLDTAAVRPTGGTWAPTPPAVRREDAVVYEMSVRNFTIDASSGVDSAKRGKFLGLVQGGTTHNGAKTGIDHLKELGVTHVQLLPSFDFNSKVPNWGYDPVNYNVPEEQFSQFTAPEDRVREFKDMVNEFHKNGIRVLMDVVYNHTYSKDALQGITGKYYTQNDLSATGNSIDDGNPMVSRMIRDSLESWVRDYNIDGFRFDLLGIHHHKNVDDWARHLNAAFPDRMLQIHGEPWSGGVSDPLEPQKVRYGTTPTLAGGHVGVFNGAYRDAIKGGTRDRNLGYMGGSASNAAAVATGMRGSPLAVKSTAPLSDPWNPAFAYDPEQTINYVSAHDDLNLWDKITYSGVSGGPSGRAGQMDRFGVGMVLTSQGIPFIHEGDEFLHSKVVGGDYETAKNSYEAPDSVNAIQWGEKTTHAATFRYYKDAIALRKSTPALRLPSWDAVKAQAVTRTDGQVVISTLSSRESAPTDHDTVVVYNPTGSTYDVSLPAGSWTKVLDSTGAVSATGSAAGSLAVTVFKKS
ncbi:alpha-amylase family glycosyl hydrolase [Streptomyces enissocaesilis]|uniref:Glycosyl hydrolase family 13 catalytic domain-containing protein n=1 Tax=Streptomyces enissocaesilis TaxID=332589 RepID=A0ABP6K1H8_9ACTN